MCFNEEYVSQFTFKPDELVNNSFDIFIRTEAYKAIEAEIKQYIENVQQQFTNNPDLEILISNLKELSGAFKITASGGLSKSTAGMKGLSGGNKIVNIPPGLEPYQPFIQSPKSVNWIDWQVKGQKEFSELSTSCPFCTSDSTEKKEQIAKVSQEYNKNLIKNLLNILDVVENLGDFLSEEARKNLHIITSLKNGIEKEHEEYVVTVKSHIDTLIEKLEKIRTLSGFHFKEGEKVGEKLPTYKVDLQFLNTLNSEKTRTIISSINQSIENLIQQAGPLQGKINIQKREMSRLVECHQKDINDFLTYAGYRYEVSIIGDDEQAQLKLRHIDNSSHLSGGSQHLSFGERNAFSIVLFMYECLAKKPDIIILDDPISSFDKNKKYAILEMLFRRDADQCLKGKTVLMLTHDVEPIIDTLKSVRSQFSNQVSATFLQLRDNEISEQPIAGNDIKTFIQICDQILASSQDPIIKLIYLRRKYEVLGELGNAYQVLSNLFKKRDTPEDHRIPSNENCKNAPLSSDDLSSGITEITSYVSDIPSDYPSMISLFKDEERIKKLYQDSNNGYEKLQLIRILLDINRIDNSVIRKFINETYHVENEFIFQLDPSRFDLMPEYVVKECDNILETFEA
ncbi:AAA family ATPase [Microbulbifer thermotolerans]|uniref:AAA family ATPase n=1 Tax=Microbulbifer thermotolerans TaxID=252514 RepID=A0AB35HTX4_MICTH|nr:AAA family ATPase [Microbulbifer thermotolerans]MCX2800396.1 AAA family ATPase [Microbulbifer thermotolerans]